MSWQRSGAMTAQRTITSMVALAPNTSETSTWDVLDTFPKLHSRAREVKTTACTEVPHSKSLDRIEIWLTIYETCDGLESFTRDPIGFEGGSNLYEYVNGMPLSMFDPMGNCAKSCNIKDFKLKEDGCKEYKNTFPDGTVLNGYGYSFSVDLTFAEPCECCSYRQYMKGSQTIELIENKKVIQTIPIYPIPGPPGGPKPPEWEEDCVIVEVPDPARPGRKKKVKNCYGNRKADPKENDKYTDKGCGYHMHDLPGLTDLSILETINPKTTVRFTMNMEFKLEVIDTCNDNKVIDTKIVKAKCSKDWQGGTKFK